MPSSTKIRSNPTTDLLPRSITALVLSLPSTLPKFPTDKKLKVTPFNQVKRVNKPWGFELWLSDGSTTPYAFKLLYVKAGTKTSLQYHNKKVEHNCLLAGTIKLHHEDPTTKQVVSHTLTAGHIISVKPPAVHRIEALTDIILVEASSPELDDVIRLSDDYHRTDGKIDSEH
jgi:mannose-6-phosphate isomerase-like protein (cupin superfamily)